MATTRATFEIKNARGAARPLYAGVGVTDLAVETVRDYLADMTDRVAALQKSIAGWDLEPEALRKQAMTLVNERVELFTKEAKTRRTHMEKRVAALQADAQALPGRMQHAVTDTTSSWTTTVNDTYGDLVKRGEGLVNRIRKQESTLAAEKSAKTTVAKAKATRTQAAKAAKSATASATKTAKKAAATPRSTAKATATSARKTAASTAKAVVEAVEKIGD